MDSGFLGWVVRGLVWIWRSHFRIPRAAYWTALGLALAGPIPLSLYYENLSSLVVGVGLTCVSALGIARWSYYRRDLIVVALPLFRTLKGQEAVAAEVQQIIMTTLQDDLGERVSWVRPIPVVVGPERRDFAIRLRERLDPRYLVYGEIRLLPDGGRSVYARVLEPLGRFVDHYDWHTRDITPQKTFRDYFYYKLTPEKNVQDAEYPFEFTTEIEALVHAIEGEFLLTVGAFEEAAESFANALEHAGDRNSEAIDSLRVSLALSLFRTGRTDQALGLLEERAAVEPVSSEILRTLAQLLFLEIGPEEMHASDRLRIIDLLKRASQDESDPKHDQTLYNLASQLVHLDEFRDEALSIYRALLNDRSSHYSRAWYVRQAIGVEHYRNAEKLKDADPEGARREGALAARYYGQALRLRPKFRFVHARAFLVLRRVPSSPILIANLMDAHAAAGHSLRARWYSVREARLKRKFRRISSRALAKENLVRAYAFAEWCLVGRSTGEECSTAVMAAYVAALAGRDDWFTRCWKRAAELNDEFARFLWSELMATYHEDDLPKLQPPSTFPS